MKRYTLQITGPDGQAAQPPQEFTSRAALDDAVRAARPLLAPGFTLVGTDTKAQSVDAPYGKRTHYAHRETAEEELQRRLDMAQRYVVMADETLHKFSADMLKDGEKAYRFRWADSAFEAAAERDAHQAVLDLAAGGRENGDAAEQITGAIVRFCINRAWEVARAPSYSTSPSHNHMERALASQYARLAESFGGGSIFSAARLVPEEDA